MTPTNCDAARLSLADLLVDDLADDRRAELQKHLQGCEACQIEAEAFFFQDRMLAEMATPVAVVHAKIVAALQAVPVRAGRVGKPVLQALPSQGRRWRALAAAACLLLAPTLLLQLVPFRAASTSGGAMALQRKGHLLPSARLEHVLGEVFVVAANSKHLATSGLALLQGQVLHVGADASATVAYSDATRLALGAQTTLSWSQSGPQPGKKAEKRVLLREGQLSAQVSGMDDDSHMIVTTPEAEVQAGNAEFFLCHAGHDTHVESEKGVLQVRRLKDGKAVQVKAGNFAAVLGKGPLGKALALNAQPVPPSVKTPLASLAAGSGVNTLVYTADGKALVSGDTDGHITFWDHASGKATRKLTGLGKSVRVLAVSPDGEHVAAGALDRALFVWKLGAAAEDKPAFTHPASTLFAAHFEDTKTLVTCGYDRAVRRWDVAAGKPLSSKKLTDYKSDFDFPACMLFANPGLLAWGLKDNTARIWDVEAGKETHVLRGHEGAVTAIAISHDSLVVATGSRDRTIMLWNFKTGELLTTLHGHRHTVNCLAFSSDNRWLASGSSDLTVKLWDVGEAKEAATLRAHTGAVHTVAFAPREPRLATGSQDGTVKIWDIKAFE